MVCANAQICKKRQNIHVPQRGRNKLENRTLVAHASGIKENRWSCEFVPTVKKSFIQQICFRFESGLPPMCFQVASDRLSLHGMLSGGWVGAEAFLMRWREAWGTVRVLQENTYPQKIPPGCPATRRITFSSPS